MCELYPYPGPPLPVGLYYDQWCSRKYLGTGAVHNISMVLFLEREHQNAIT